MTNTLSVLAGVRQRFSRSANIERDNSTDAISGYLPTARALDVVRRVVDGIEDPRAGRSISVTGPYGSGKSSLGLFLAALLGGENPLRTRADVLLAESDPDLARRLVQIRALQTPNGFVCSAAVGQRESIVETVLRALRFGMDRFVADNPRVVRDRAFKAVREIPREADPAELRGIVMRVADYAPVLLVLDEFGKNLEHFVSTDTSRDDLFLLQDLAEWSAAASGKPIMLLTLQHLAFEDYAAGASVSKRREWSKIQGRFADVPYVESPSQSQTLIASVFEKRGNLSKWAESVRAPLLELGGAEILHVRPEDVYPLHPITAAVLPQLCARYGQNERTLFSFLAGPDPLAVPEFLATVKSPARAIPPCVRLDRVYDFFLESSSTTVSASATASRWMEIETRIRDTAGLTDSELRILKAVAVLNLVSAGGNLRASAAMLAAVGVDGLPGTESRDELVDGLGSLEARGVLTYREYADEYRVWSGSDFDLKGSLAMARREQLEVSTADLLQKVRPLAPMVAARHSQRTGTLRVFERRFVGDRDTNPTNENTSSDGLVLLHVGSPNSFAIDLKTKQAKPVILGRSPLIAEVEEAARELSAHLSVLSGPQGVAADWVAKRELRERAAVAASSLDGAIERAFGPAAVGTQWLVCGDSGQTRRARKVRTLSALLSDLCDAEYPDSPILRNEMIGRRDLTSQAARARRELLSAMVTNSEVERCGLEGFGPERAIYEAVLSRTGIHRVRDGVLSFGAPSTRAVSKALNFGPLWKRIEQLLASANEEQIQLQSIYEQLQAPPVGLKEGILPVLVTAAVLAHRGHVAIYENGSFIAQLDEPVIERLLRNPELFSLKSFATRGPRQAVVERLSKVLAVPTQLDSSTDLASLVAVVGTLLGRVRDLPAYSRRTSSLTQPSLNVRAACVSATEPDVLLFKLLPAALGVKEIRPTSRASESEVDEFVDLLNGCLAELENCFGGLLDNIEKALRTGLAVRGQDVRGNVAGRVSQFADAILDLSVKAFVSSLTDASLPRGEWLEYVGMVTINKPPSSWTDDDVKQFDFRIIELSQAVRRLEGLHFDLRDKEGEGFEAIRVAFTTPSGVDHARVLTIDDGVAEDLDSFVSDLLERAGSELGPNGREMVLAKLALEVLGEARPREEVPEAMQTTLSDRVNSA